TMVAVAAGLVVLVFTGFGVGVGDAGGTGVVVGGSGVAVAGTAVLVGTAVGVLVALTGGGGGGGPEDGVDVGVLAEAKVRVTGECVTPAITTIPMARGNIKAAVNRLFIHTSVWFSIGWLHSSTDQEYLCCSSPFCNLASLQVLCRTIVPPEKGTSHPKRAPPGSDRSVEPPPHAILLLLGLRDGFRSSLKQNVEVAEM
ncbi:MAG: hypothetical protein ACRDFX_06670, partial [Chloroflexota bacterium]